MKRIFFSNALLAMIFCAMASAQIPKTLNYQGLLTDADGKSVTDRNYELRFTLYDQPTGGAALWSENQTVATSSVVFNVLLGKIEPMNLPFDAPYWLGIKVGNEAELSPRIELTGTAYSLTSRTVVDGAITRKKLANGAVTPDKLNTNGAAPGQVLSYNGDAVVWSEVSAGDDNDWLIKGKDIYRVDGSVSLGTDKNEGTLTVKSHRARAGHFTSDSLDEQTHIVHSEYTGPSGEQEVKAVFGKAVPADGFGLGGEFEGGSAGVSGIGRGGDSEGYVYGVLGRATGSQGRGFRVGVLGITDHYDQPNNWAGVFIGDVEVAGDLQLQPGAVDAFEMLDEPGLSLGSRSNRVSIHNSGETIILSHSINVPARGYVLAIATGVFEGSGGRTTNKKNTIIVDIRVPFFSDAPIEVGNDINLIASQFHIPFSLQRVFPVFEAGIFTVDLVGRRGVSSDPDATSEVGQPALSLLYFPTSYERVFGITENPGNLPVEEVVTIDDPENPGNRKTAYKVDLRHYELQALKAREKAQRAELELIRAQAERAVSNQ